MDDTVGAVAEPKLALVRRECDAMAGAAVALHGALCVALDLDAVEQLARPEVADLEAEQIVHVREHQRPRAVDGEWADDVAERSDDARDAALRRIHHGER